MDFGSVLYKAQKNEENTKQGNWYKTTYAPPKKQQREKKISVNVQKFLARKEEEEKQKQVEAELKKQELLALRNKDKKSSKRVQSMLKRTKSANYSVIEDAVDNINTAVTLNGPLQPDEDDYGYVSKDASALYDKLINKYSNIPSENDVLKKSKPAPKISEDISTTKDRVKAALQREEDEKLLPRKRKRKSKQSGDDKSNEIADSGSSEDEKDESRENGSKEKESKNRHKEKGLKEKDEGKPNKFRIPKRNNAPPPMDFQALLKLAEQKQHEPVVIEKKVSSASLERPMTEKEKEEYRRLCERKDRREVIDPNDIRGKIGKHLGRRPEARPLPKPPSEPEPVTVEDKLKKEPNVWSAPCNVSPQSAKSISKIRRIEKNVSDRLSKPLDGKHEVSSTCSSNDVKNSHKISKITANNEKQAISGKSTLNLSESSIKSEEKKLSKSSATPKISNQHTEKVGSKESESRLSYQKTIDEEREIIEKKRAMIAERRALIEEQRALMEEEKRIMMEKRAKASMQVTKPKVVQSKEEPRKKFPPEDLKRSRPFPPPDMAKRPVKRPQAIISDEEEDSEMDDFIDDTEDPGDVSKYISEIFKYDRSKYSRIQEDDEDECMESNFSELQKEEYESTKHGILEDLEDVRRSKQEKERKKKRLMALASMKRR